MKFIQKKNVPTFVSMVVLAFQIEKTEMVFDVFVRQTLLGQTVCTISIHVLLTHVMTIKYAPTKAILMTVAVFINERACPYLLNQLLLI